MLVEYDVSASCAIVYLWRLLKGVMQILGPMWLHGPDSHALGGGPQTIAQAAQGMLWPRPGKKPAILCAS